MRRFRFALHLLSVRSGRRLVVCFVVLVDIAAVVLTINQAIRLLCASGRAASRALEAPFRFKGAFIKGPSSK